MLLVNDTIIPTGDVKTYYDQQMRSEKLAHALKIAETVVNKVGVLADKALEAVWLKKEVRMVVQAHPDYNILGEQYTTLGAIRYGNYVGKIGFAPLSENVKALSGQSVDLTEQSAWRDLVVNFFAPKVPNTSYARSSAPT